MLVLLALLLAFAFHQYQLTWESTILSPAFFDAFVRVTGWLAVTAGWFGRGGGAAERKPRPVHLPCRRAPVPCG